MSDFRYARLLEVKERIIEQKRGQLDMALTTLAAVADEIEKAQQEASRTYEEITERCLTGKELSVLLGHLAFLDRKKASLDVERSRIEDRIVGLRKELYDLEVELKMLEKLESKTRQLIKKTQNKKEQKLMDELALRAEGQ